MEMNLILLEDQEIIGTDQSFSKGLLIWKIGRCFSFGILAAMVHTLLSFRFEMLRDCIKLNF